MHATKTPNVKVVPITEKHIEGFYRCLDAVARERRYLALVEAPPLDSAREFVCANIAADVPQYVAVVDGEVVGWCDIIPLPREGFRHCGTLGMGVQKDYRGKGIGRRLIVATLEKARAKGLERVEFEVYPSNVAAFKLYEQLGFAVEGVKQRARKIDGAYEDMIEMALFLD